MRYDFENMLLLYKGGGKGAYFYYTISGFTENFIAMSGLEV